MIMLSAYFLLAKYQDIHFVTFSTSYHEKDLRGIFSTDGLLRITGAHVWKRLPTCRIRIRYCISRLCLQSKLYYLYIKIMNRVVIFFIKVSFVTLVPWSCDESMSRYYLSPGGHSMNHIHWSLSVVFCCYLVYIDVCPRPSRSHCNWGKIRVPM